MVEEIGERQQSNPFEVEPLKRTMPLSDSFGSEQRVTALAPSHGKRWKMVVDLCTVRRKIGRTLDDFDTF